MLTGKWKIPWKLIELVEQIQVIIKKIVIEIICIYQEANQLADYIVNKAFNQEDKIQYNCFAQLSSTSKRVLNTDKSQIPILRVRIRPITASAT